MPKKGTPHACPQCGSMQLKRELKERHILITCERCGHVFKSRSKVARRHWRGA